MLEQGAGIGVAALAPRLVAGVDRLAARRGEVRPVTRGRRLLGMAPDGVHWTWASLLGMACGAVRAGPGSSHDRARCRPERGPSPVPWSGPVTG